MTILRSTFHRTPLTHSTTRWLAVLCGACLGLIGCDNVGGAFDPDGGGRGGGGGGGGSTQTTIQAMLVDGVSFDGRPKVANVFPKGNGWPGTVPIVVEFNETIAEASVSPQGGTPTLFVREKQSTGGGGQGGGQGGGGAPLPLPASYDFLLGGRVVIIRPNAAFDPTQAKTYEVVVGPELRDADGVRFGGSADKVIATFTADKSNDIKDGEILTTLPVNNSRDQIRQSKIYLIFTKPCTQNSIRTSGANVNFSVGLAGKPILAGASDFPIRATGFGASGNDGRILELDATALFAANTQHEIVVKDTILFPSDGKLAFRGRTPFARFTTTGAPPPDGVKVGNPAAGAIDKVNSSNINMLDIDVDVPADAGLNDQVVVRIYGLHKAGGTTGSLNFFEAKAIVPRTGKQTVRVSFGARLGTAASPNLREGPLLFATYLVRGNRSSGYVLSSTATAPALDVTPPTLTTPAADSAGNRFAYTDLEHITLFGTAGEDLSSATLTLDSTPAPAPGTTTGTVFGAGSGGRFMFRPILLGRRMSPLGFSVTVTDAAGNESPPVTGKIVQRGTVTGSVGSGTLVVEAYDAATFLPIAGATVLVEPGMPTAGATGRKTAVTQSDGRATFTGLTAATHSITIVRGSYNLVSLLDTAAGFASLPLRPQSRATGSVRGTAVFTAGTGQSALIGCNIFDDITREEIATTLAAPRTIPATPVLPNRPYIMTAFGGSFEPRSNPTFVNFACSICGVTGMVVEAARAPVNPGGTGVTTLPLLPSAGTTRNLALTYNKDLSTFVGLDTANLVGTPTVRIMTTVFGMPRSTMTGIGFATQVGATPTYTVNGSYSAATALAMAVLLPRLWVSVEARDKSGVDKSGVVTRHRSLILDPVVGNVFDSPTIPAVLTITAPAGSSADSPAVTYQDRLDATAIPQTFGFHVITATSGTRSWRILRQDKTGATGAITVQLPVFSNVKEPGLAKGPWKIRTESHLIFSGTMGIDDYVVEEIRHEEVTFARTPETTFTVN
jgi:hypothetical protein